MVIKAVFFDMGGTLETFSYTRELRLKAAAGIRQRLVAAGIHLLVDDEQLLDVITGGLRAYHQWRMQTLQELPSWRIWCDYILSDFPVDRQALKAIAEDLMFSYENDFYQREMRPEIPAVLEALQKMGLKIGLISNISSLGLVPSRLKQYGIDHYFDPVVLSSTYGRRKPDPAIFHYAARLANVPTSQCVYVGDRIARDILGARRAGFGMAIQIQHDFAHGEHDDGATPDALIHQMTGLLDLLKAGVQGEASPRPHGPVRAFVFDAGDVLYHRPERGKKLAAFLAALSLNQSENHSAQKLLLGRQVYRGQITQDEYRTALLQLYGVTQPEQLELGKKILDEEDNDVHFFAGVPQTLIDLKRRGYLLGIITDTANPVHVKLRWFEQGGFGHVWDSIISSQEIGVRKPHPAIYRAALQQLGVTPDQAVFVGHKPSELDGARALGMRTVAFNYDQASRADRFVDDFSDLLQITSTFEERPLQVAEQPLWDISLSTMWAMKKPPRLATFLGQAHSLEIPQIELNHQVDSAMLNEIDLHGLSVSSIHEPCPADIPVDVLKQRDWLISATDEAKRRQGVLAMKRSLDLASRLGVKAIVVHAGNVSGFSPLERRMYELFKSGHDKTPKYLELKNQLVMERGMMATQRLEAVKQSLQELLDYAQPLGICLGLENRYHYVDIPIPDEMEQLLSLAGPESLGFWYDVGHAHTLDRLGFFPHQEWLERFASRIIGVHLHDALGINDHRTPGTGEIDFGWLAGYLPTNAIRTLEVNADNTPEQVRDSLLILAQEGCIRRL